MRKAEKMPLKKGTWSPEEDQKLITYINRYGIWNWIEMPKAADLSRSWKSCRLRWMNYLRPNIKHGDFTREEEETIFKLHEVLGNSWSAIAAKLGGRTDNDVKNYWNTNVRKLLKKKATSTNKLQECGVEASNPTFPGKGTVQVEATPEGKSGLSNVPIALNSEISKDLSTSSPANELSSYNLVSSFQSIGLSENLEFSLEGLHKIDDYYTEETWHGEPIIFSNSFCDDYSLLYSVNDLSGDEQSFYGQQFQLENEPYYSYSLFEYPSLSSDELHRVIDENIGLTGEFRGLWD